MLSRRGMRIGFCFARLNGAREGSNFISWLKFLRIDYDGLVERVKEGGTDKEILDWCFTVGRKPTEDDIYVWNEFMRKRGWNDEVSEMVVRRKAEAGMTDRSDIQTSFQFIDADE